MPRVIPQDEYDLIRRVEELGAEGNTFSEIARLLDQPVGTLRYQLEKHGLEPVACVEVRAKLGRQRLSDLIAQGALVAEDRQPVGAL